MPVDRSIDPTAEQVRNLRDHKPDGPIVMLNLLKFRESAQYPDDREETPCSGRDAYARYQKIFVETLGSVSNAEVLYEGPVNQVFIGQADEANMDWDKALIVRYPSRKHFLKMMANDHYREEALVHRYAGLERTVLLQCEG